MLSAIFRETYFFFQRQEQMSQTELDVSHGYAFSQVESQRHTFSSLQKMTDKLFYQSLTRRRVEQCHRQSISEDTTPP